MRRAARASAALLIAMAGVVSVTSPADAATCADARGVSAVADFNDGAGGGITSGCDRSGAGKTAIQVFQAVGYTFTRNHDGSICQINGKPSDARCGRLGDQYWGLWWSDGKSGEWVYSQQGGDALRPEAGWSVGWAWQGPSGRRPPGMAPAVHQSTPTPTPTPTPKPSSPTESSTDEGATSGPVKNQPQESTGAMPSASSPGAGTTPTVSTSPRTTASPTATQAATTRPSRTSSATVAPTDSDDAETAAAPPPGSISAEGDPSEDGLPGWVPVGLVVGLSGAAAAAVAFRRRGV